MSLKRSFFERLTGSISAHDDEDSTTTDKGLKGTPNANGNRPWLDEEEGELAVDVYQTPSEIVIRTMISGVKPEDLTISITREMVTIKGHRESTREINDDDYFQRELYWGGFSRTILLPAEVEVEEAEAIEKHGLLTIRLPKIDREKTSNLKIKSL
jgi:HSP20 family protein